MKDESFWETVERCKETVKTWPQWMKDVDLSKPHCADEDA